MWLGATSSFKAESDLLKYEKARKLKDYITDIRKNYKRDWESSDVRKKQVRVWAVCGCIAGSRCANAPGYTRPAEVPFHRRGLQPKYLDSAYGCAMHACCAADSLLP